MKRAALPGLLRAVMEHKVSGDHASEPKTA
jgi:hypothetical protein